MTHFFMINVAGKNGYSIPVKSDLIDDEYDVIDAAVEADLFEDPNDADYAEAEDITYNMGDRDSEEFASVD